MVLCLCVFTIWRWSKYLHHRNVTLSHNIVNQITIHTVYSSMPLFVSFRSDIYCHQGNLGWWDTLVRSRGHPLLNVDTGNSRQLDDWFKNYRSGLDGLKPRKTSWHEELAAVARFRDLGRFLYWLTQANTVRTYLNEECRNDFWWSIIWVLVHD